jgi:hypothetical protein
VQLECSHVFDLWKDIRHYEYCTKEGTVWIGGNPFCEQHGAEVDIRAEQE